MQVAQRLIILLAITALMGVFPAAHPALAADETFTVNISADRNSTCGSGGQCSLREAINAANAKAAGTDRAIVAFNIPTSDPKFFAAGYWELSVTLSQLPAITRANVTIDGTTQPSGNVSWTHPRIVIINGLPTGASGTPADGLRLRSSGNIVRGLTIGGFTVEGVNEKGAAITIGTSTITASDNRIEGCYLGTTAAGTNRNGNNHGVFIVRGSNNLIGGSTPAARNVISGNGSSNGANITVLGVSSGRSNNNQVLGNYVGTTADGMAQIGDGNQNDGVVVGAYADNTLIQGNVIAGHNGANNGSRVGIELNGSSIDPSINQGTLIYANYIGTNKDGTNPGNLATLNNESGIQLRAGQNVQIGDLNNDARRNIIAGNGTANTSFIGIWVFSQGNNPPTVSTINIHNNWIGLNAAAAPLGNGRGIRMDLPGFTGIDIRKNWIAANRSIGIEITAKASTTPTVASNSVIAGNFIGTNQDGSASGSTLYNGQSGTGSGIAVIAGNGLTIGGPNAADRNIIADDGAGITLGAIVTNVGTGQRAIANNNTVRSNSIGVNAAGNVALLNVNNDGILITNEANNNLIVGNVIAGNLNGIQISGSLLVAGGTRARDNRIEGNTIGLQGVPNRALGIWVNGTPNNIIGGTAPGTGNTISSSSPTNDPDGILVSGANSNNTQILGNQIRNNDGVGVRVNTAVGVRISRTATSTNGGKGIFLESNGNLNLARPTLTRLDPGPLLVGNAPGCANCTIEIFASPTRDDREGPAFLTSGTADGSGNFSINVAGCERFLTVTARDANDNTSPFSDAIDTGTVCLGPEPQLGAGTPASSSGSPVLVTPNVAGGANVAQVFRHRLTNAGGQAGTFTINAVSSSGWSTVPSITSVALNPGQFVDIDVTVQVPPGVGGQADNRVDVTASVGVRNVTVSDYIRPVATSGVNIEPSRVLTFPFQPNIQVRSYTHTITNTSNGPDTLNWVASVSPNSGPGAATFVGASSGQCASIISGGSCTITVQIQIPGNTPVSVYTTLVTATSQRTPATSDQVSNIDQVQSPDLNVNSLPRADVTPAGSTTFIHTLQNVGTGTITVTVGQTIIPPAPAGWTFIQTPTVGTPIVIPSGETRLVSLTAILAASVVSGTEVTARLSFTPSVGPAVVRDDVVRALQRPGLSLGASTPDTVNAFPDDTASFTHTLINEGNGPDNFTIATVLSPGLTLLSVTPTGPISLQPNGTAGDRTDIVVTVRVNAGAAPGPRGVLVTAQRSAAPQLPVSRTDTVNVQGAARASFGAAQTQNLTLPGPLNYTRPITNTGNQAGTFSVSAPVVPPGWNVVVTPVVAGCLTNLAAGAACELNVQVTPAAQALAGAYVITLQGNVTSAPTSSTSVQETINVLPAPAIAFTPNRQGDAAPAVAIVYTHTVTNTGNVTSSVNFSAQAPPGWNVALPATIVNLAPNDFRTVTVTITPPPALPAGPGAVVTVTAALQSFPSTTASVADTTNILAAAGALLTPFGPTSGVVRPSGVAPGSITFPWTLLNSGNQNISYTLGLSPALPPGWSATLEPTSTAVLIPGQSIPVSVTVSADSSVPLGSVQVVDLLVQNGATPQLLASGAVSVTVGEAVPWLTPTSSSGAAFPGGTAVYTHTLTNISAITGTFNLRALSSRGWLTETSPASARLSPGDQIVVSVITEVPANTRVLTDIATLQVIRQETDSVVATAEDSTQVVQVAGINIAEPIVVSSTLGQVWVFQHRIQNLGNESDTFVITASTSLNWPIRIVSPPGGIRAVGFNRSYEQVLIEVTVPANAPLGIAQAISVRATSQYDLNVSAVLNNVITTPPLPPPPPPQFKVYQPLVVRPR